MIVKTQDHVYVTPELAQRFLDSSSGNRHVSVSHVRKLAADMADGKWQYNGDRIRFRADGSLQDGHHRLTACVQSGVPIYVDVFVIPESAEVTVDKGKSRTSADTLALSGAIDPAMSSTLAAALRLLTVHDNTTVSDWAGSIGAGSQAVKLLTEQALGEYFEANKYAVIRAVEWSHEHVKKQCTLISKSQAAAFIFLAGREYDFDSASEYLLSVLTGYGLNPESTAAHIRDRLLSVKMRQSKMTAKDKLYSVCKGFRSIMAGRTIKYRNNAVFRPNQDSTPRFEVKK